MTQTNEIGYRFVDAIPENPEQGVLYLALDYGAAIHLCCCGCGYEVSTPLSPTDWSLTFNGVSVSLTPSVGNWSLPCRSHYIIDRGKVRWAAAWDSDQVDAVRRYDKARKKSFYDEGIHADTTHRPLEKANNGQQGLFAWIKSLFR